MGDLNTKFFHQFVRQKRQRLYIHKIKRANRQILTAHDDIICEEVNYFRQQLNGDHTSQREEPLLNIPRLLFEEDSTALDQPPSLEEIQAVIESMDNNSSAGPDGFNGFFTSIAGTTSKLTFIKLFLIFLQVLNCQDPRQVPS